MQWKKMGFKQHFSLVRPGKGMKGDNEDSEDDDEEDNNKMLRRGEGMRMDMSENKKTGRSRMRMAFRDSAAAIGASAVGAVAGLYLF